MQEPTAAAYQAAGLALCAIPRGTKGPRSPDWGDNPLPPGASAEGLGLIHRRSHTCAIDLDHLPAAADWLAARGVALDELLGAPDAVHIVSGRPGRAKLLYRLPHDVEWLPTLRLADGALELRCASRTGGANVQDVLPPSIHPDTGKPYRWAGAGDWRHLPELPPELLALWRTQAEPQPSAAALPAAQAPDRYAARALERAAAAVLGAGEGGRNDTLNAAAYGLARLAAAGRLDWNDTAATLERAALAAGLAPAEVRATLASAHEAGAASPNHEGAPEHGAPDMHAAPQEAPQRAAEPRLTPVDVQGVLTQPSPPPRFVWGQYLPRGVASMLGAHGGTGKSTVALLLAVAVAAGRELFGQPTERGRVVFASLEDGAAVVRHRLAHVCRQWGIEPGDLAQHLTIVDGTAAPELFIAEGRGQGTTTATYAELQELAQGAALVIVDNASDAYAGDEIQRQQVRAFVRCLASIARAEDCALLLLAHVDKATSRARKAEGGEGYSGSTAWHNSVRSRLFMTRAEDGALTLEHQKSNLGPLAAPLVLRWPHGGLPELDTPAAGIVAHIAERVDTQALLRLIAEYSERGERVAVGTTARTNAARLLADESAYPKGRKPGEVFDLLRRAQRAGYLEAASYKGADRHQREAWHVTSKGRAYAGLPPEPAGTAGTAGTYEAPAPAAPAAPAAGSAGTA